LIILLSYSPYPSIHFFFFFLLSSFFLLPSSFFFLLSSFFFLLFFYFFGFQAVELGAKVLAAAPETPNSTKRIIFLTDCQSSSSDNAADVCTFIFTFLD
jgi:hypothetical protein